MTRHELRLLIAKKLLDEMGGSDERSVPIYNLLYDGGLLDTVLRAEKGTKLTIGERMEAGLAIQDLMRGEYIAPTATAGSVVVTPKGRYWLATSGPLTFQTLRLDEIVSDPEILRRCEANFQQRDFDLAVFCAFKIVEERLRAKSGLGADALGVELVNKALSPSTGVMKYKHAQTSSEAEGVHRLFSGAVGLFKNPGSHRTIEFSDEMKAARAVAFADLLVSLIADLDLKTP